MKSKILLFGAAGLAVVAWLVSRIVEPRPDSGGPLYRTFVVERGDVVRTVTATGALRALNTVTVGSQVSGNVARILAGHNDGVAAGQLLAEIEPSSYRARVAQAEGDLAEAEATRDLRRVQAERAAELRARDLIAVSEYDAVEAEKRRQEAVVAKAAAALESARVDLARTSIHAPIAGIVVDRAVEAGQTVQASFSAPTLFTLAEDLRRMEITANVSEADIGGVAPGQPVAFTVDAFPARTFAGVVRQVRNNPATTQNVVTYPTIITVENDDLRLRPGMTAYVTITVERRENVPRVANAALRFRPADGVGERSAEQSAVYVLAPETTAPRLRRVVVGTGNEIHVEIVEGLREGERVVVGLVEGAADGDAARNPFLPTPPGARR